MTGEVARRHGLVFEEGTTYPLLAFARLLRGDLPGAAASSADGLRFATSHAAWHAATYSVTLLLTASAFGDEVLVARIHGVLLPVMAEAIAGQLPHSRPMFLAAIGHARATLGEEAFAAEEATTVRLDRDASIDWAIGAARRLADPENAAAHSPTEPVTPPPRSRPRGPSAPRTRPSPASRNASATCCGSWRGA